MRPANLFAGRTNVRGGADTRSRYFFFPVLAKPFRNATIFGSVVLMES
ncbi:MAG: hypothetical protein ACI9MU_003448, partial [Alphaproteobacteria bacterium]